MSNTQRLYTELPRGSTWCPTPGKYREYAIRTPEEATSVMDEFTDSYAGEKDADGLKSYCDKLVASYLRDKNPHIGIAAHLNLDAAELALQAAIELDVGTCHEPRANEKVAKRKVPAKKAPAARKPSKATSKKVAAPTGRDDQSETYAVQGFPGTDRYAPWEWEY